MKNRKESISIRQTEITEKFLFELDKHLTEPKSGLT